MAFVKHPIGNSLYNFKGQTSSAPGEKFFRKKPHPLSFPISFTPM